MTEVLYLAKSHIETMIAHAAACEPEEGCGLLAGRGDVVELTLLITNQYRSPVRYNMEPKELIEAFYHIEERGMGLLATFHSHPTGPSRPSATDLAEYAYPEAYAIILSKEAGFWDYHGYKIKNNTYLEIRLHIR